MELKELTLKQLLPYYNEYLKRYNKTNKDVIQKKNKRYYDKQRKNSKFNRVI